MGAHRTLVHATMQSQVVCRRNQKLHDGVIPNASTRYV